MKAFLLHWYDVHGSLFVRRIERKLCESRPSPRTRTRRDRVALVDGVIPLMAVAMVPQDAPSPTKRATRGPAPPVLRDPSDPRGTLAVQTGFEDQIRQRAMAARAGSFETLSASTEA